MFSPPFQISQLQFSAIKLITLYNSISLPAKIPLLLGWKERRLLVSYLEPRKSSTLYDDKAFRFIHTQVLFFLVLT